MCPKKAGTRTARMWLISEPIRTFDYYHALVRVINSDGLAGCLKPWRDRIYLWKLLIQTTTAKPIKYKKDTTHAKRPTFR